MDGRSYRGEGRVREHSLHLVNRARLAITGVREVISFDDRVVVLDTDQGMLTLRGEGLHIKQLDLESGDFLVEGTVSSALYTVRDGRKFGPHGKNFFLRILR